MAFAAAPQASHTLSLLGSPKSRRAATTTRNSSRHVNYVGTFHVHASTSSSQAEGPSKRERPPPAPGIDTRIHWDNEDEGWIGGSSSKTNGKTQQVEQEQHKDVWGNKFADLLDDSADSHYQFLGVSAEADIEEIKAAYRRLSKEYHPDTTSLPLKTASDKFVRLREIYDVLSNEESRRFYNWTLAQEAASRQAEMMRMRLEDPYVKEVETYEPIPDMVDRLGGRNMALGDQAVTALTIDVFIIIFAICCIVYVIVFKEPYY
ncbi:putative DnaJ domain-containing protein [Rosa chinensis]|uniref:Putative DnaJ domain-containing protein n=1 Tax=Rosa chinensis TaxID=74649 RepID=A0A2P6PEX2_ROSCH|nr:NAD(P)H-quinone oxidoreductase subunit T, chloroplastic [Rosa chinensis]PRQ20475.1 putative DnaJ domain-containing protein [Rosa chinensis]